MAVLRPLDYLSFPSQPVFDQAEVALLYSALT